MVEDEIKKISSAVGWGARLCGLEYGVHILSLRLSFSCLEALSWHEKECGHWGSVPRHDDSMCLELFGVVLYILT